MIDKLVSELEYQKDRVKWGLPVDGEALKTINTMLEDMHERN